MLSETFYFAWNRTTEKATIEQIVCFILAIIISLVMAVCFFDLIDRVPAKIDDYLPLNEKLLSVESNPDCILIGNGTIIIEDDKITYTIENEECKMTGIYDNDYKLIGKKQEDKALSTFGAVLSCLMLFVIMVSLTYFASLVAIFIICFIISIISQIIEKHKKSVEEKSLTQDHTEECNNAIESEEYYEDDIVEDDDTETEDDVVEDSDESKKENDSSTDEST